MKLIRREDSIYNELLDYRKESGKKYWKFYCHAHTWYEITRGVRMYFVCQEWR
jgi:hypothetical protein